MRKSESAKKLMERIPKRNEIRKPLIDEKQAKEMIFGANILEEREVTSTLPNEPSQDGDVNR